MLDCELGRVHPGSGVQFAQRMIVMTFLQKREIRCFRKVTLVVQQVKNAHRLLRDQMDNRQVILRQSNYFLRFTHVDIFRESFLLRNNCIARINLTV